MTNPKWYQKTSGIVLMIILFFPVGLFMMWRYSSWSTLTKAVITGVFAIILFWNPNGSEDGLEVQNSAAIQQVEEAEQARLDSIVKAEKELEKQKCIADADAFYLELKKMHEELQSFRSTKLFNDFGFGRGGAHYPWLEKIGKMKGDPRNKCCLIYKNCVAGDLEMLGMEYVTSDGRDTDYSIATSMLFGGPSPNTATTNTSASNSPSYSNSRNWYEGGTLHKATVARWKASTNQNKLATCGDFIAATDKSISSMTVLKLRAEELKTCIDIATSGHEYADNFGVATMAALCIKEMGY